MHPAQRRLGAVEGVLGPVLVECLREADRVFANAGEGVAGPVVGLGVDVVAEVDHEVHVLLDQEVVGVEVAEGVVLAGEEGEADRLARIGRQRGAEAADRALLAASGEAVPVLLVGIQARDPRLDGVPDVVRGLDQVARHDLAKAAVARHLDLHGAAALHVVHPRPQRDGVGRGIAGDHALGEAPAAQAGLALGTRGQRGGPSAAVARASPLAPAMKPRRERASPAGKARSTLYRVGHGRQRPRRSEPEFVAVVVAVLLAALLDVVHVRPGLGERHVLPDLEALHPARLVDPAVDVRDVRRCMRRERRPRCPRSDRSGSAGNRRRRRC